MEVEEQVGIKNLFMKTICECWHRLVLSSLEDWAIWRSLASDQIITLVAQRHGMTREDFVAELEQYSFEILNRFGEAPQSVKLNQIKEEDGGRRLSCGTLPLSLEDRLEISANYSSLYIEFPRRIAL